MTVVTVPKEICRLSSAGPNDHCTLCHGKLWPPFLEWHGRTDIFICGECCEKNKEGLTADLIQVTAIVGLKRLYNGDYTLVRTSRAHHNEEARKQMELDDAALDQPNVSKLHN